jgi:uncharacterized protein YdeI (YjbR/CyaY-like superfamily)
MRKFTPRKDDSDWSASNIKRVEKLIKENRMTSNGMRMVESARRSGRWKPVEPPVVNFEPSDEFLKVLAENPKAEMNFHQLSGRHRKEYTGWINTAKREETRKRRIDESVKLLEKAMKLGLK